MGYAAAPTGQGLVGQAAAAAGGTVYVPAAKRRKTAEEKAAAAEKKRQLQVRLVGLMYVQAVTSHHTATTHRPAAACSGFRQGAGSPDTPCVVMHSLPG
jgi:hypothetical protein